MVTTSIRGKEAYSCQYNDLEVVIVACKIRREITEPETSYTYTIFKFVQQTTILRLQCTASEYVARRGSFLFGLDLEKKRRQRNTMWKYMQLMPTEKVLRTELTANVRLLISIPHHPTNTILTDNDVLSAT